MTEPEHQPLRAAFDAAERQREALERGQPPGMAAYGDAVAAAVAAYERCAARIDLLALFSPNEAAEDLATAHLRYLVVPLRVAELVQRLPVVPGGGDDDDLPRARRALLRRARDAYERFLHQLDGYGLLAPPYARLLAAYAEAPASFSMAGRAGGTGGSGDPTADAAARRSAKIAGFRAEKALQDKLAALRQQQQARRALQRQRGGRRIRGAGGAVNDKDEDEDHHDNDDHDDDDDDDDDEQTRALALAELEYSAHLALQGLEGLNREDALLAQVRAADLHGGGGGGTAGRLGGLGDGRQRQRDDERVPAGSGTGTGGPSLRQLQNMLGSTATVMGGGGRGTTATGALLTTDGKPRQPFTILGSRAERARAVFQTGHSLPTMSIDEYLAEERRRGGIVDGGGPGSGQAPEPDEDDMERADAETVKARAWDEFTEANPKGAGNTLNRG